MARYRIRKTAWRLFWGLRDKRKQMTKSAKDRLESLPHRTKRRIVLGMLAVFAVLALYTFGKAVYDIGRDESPTIETGHIKPLNVNAYGTDED